MAAPDVLARYTAFEQALTQLIGPVRFRAETNMRLERITHLLELLGNPQQTYPLIHVGGTAGKGSTAAIAAAILTAAGYRTGLHLSPPLQILNEGYHINQQIVSTSRLVACLNAIQPAIAQVAATNPYGAPTFFEVQVALALYLFQQEAVDVAVIEVGLGGTTDATNVVPAAVSVITNIGLDHTDILGNTIASITEAKAGIIKPGQQVISGVQQIEAQQIIARHCQAQGAHLWQLGAEFGYLWADDGSLTVYAPGHAYHRVKLAMPGLMQGANAACAIAAVAALPLVIPNTAAIPEAIGTVQLPGRMEIVQKRPLVVLDGAHNPDKLCAAIAALQALPACRRRIVVFALKSGKPVADLLPTLLAGTDMLIVTTFRVRDLWTPTDPQQLAVAVAALAPDCALHVIVDPLEALTFALSTATPDDLILVTGSLYLVGDVRAHWYPVRELLERAERYNTGTLE